MFWHAAKALPNISEFTFPQNSFKNQLVVKVFQMQVFQNVKFEFPFFFSFPLLCINGSILKLLY